jgi:hypothetical protein
VAGPDLKKRTLARPDQAAHAGPALVAAGCVSTQACGRSGPIAPAGALGRSLLALRTDHEQGEESARAGLRRARGLEWSKIVAQYDELYQDVLSRRPAREAGPS